MMEESELLGRYLQSFSMSHSDEYHRLLKLGLTVRGVDVSPFFPLCCASRSSQEICVRYLQGHVGGR
jgi:hypothetical protein